MRWWRRPPPNAEVLIVSAVCCCAVLLYSVLTEHRVTSRYRVLSSMYDELYDENAMLRACHEWAVKGWVLGDITMCRSFDPDKHMKRARP